MPRHDQAAARPGQGSQSDDRRYSDDEQVSDQRYLVVNGRRWRRSDPTIPPGLRQQLVNELMSARRAVKAALASGNSEELADARARVQDAKVALGERGRAWWLTAREQDTRGRLQAAIRSLLRNRDAGKTICPSEVARTVGADQWRSLMPLVREVAGELVQSGWLEITQGGEAVNPPSKGAIRLRRVQQ